MSQTTVLCERCGRRLPRHHSGGNCPWCLFAATLGEPTAQPDGGRSCNETSESLADFTGLEEVGRGGTSVVYRARQMSVQRVVALKMLHGSAVAHRDAYQRLQIEAEAVARLEHPHIVPLYGVGRDSGTLFLVLRHFERGSLSEALRRRRFTPIESARLVITAARAVHHAHERGVIHRDLKPSNLLLDEKGAPHVADFGLARLADHDSRLTLTHSVMGTPSYMAPEQARGDSRAVGTPADTYALGAILYELLAGRPPFLGATTVETLRQVVEADPPSLRSLVPGICRDLEAICLHCLEKAPHRRYPSAAGLANDLERWLNHETLSVRPGSAATQLIRWVHRRPIVAGLAAAVAVTLVVGLASTTWQWRRATASERRTARLLYAANMNLAQSDWQAGNLSRLLSLLRETASSPERGFEWYYWQREAHQELLTLHAHTRAVTDFDFSPDGRHLATAGADGMAKVWDLVSGRDMIHLPHDRPIHSIEYSRDGARLLTGDEAGVVRMWNATHGQPERVFAAHHGPVTAILSPDGTRIVTAGWDSTVKGWDATDGRCLFTSRVTWGRVKSAAFLPDGNTVLTGGEDGTLRFWDAATGRELRVLKAHDAQATVVDINAIDVASDGTRFATAGYDRTIRVWSLPEAIELLVLRDPELHATGVALAPDGRQVASCSIYNTYVPRIWSTGDSNDPALDKLPAHEWPITHIEFSPDGTRLATSCGDGTVRLWRAGATRKALQLPTGRPRLTAFPGGDRLIVAQERGAATVHETSSARIVAEWPGLEQPMAVAPDGTVIAGLRGNAAVVLLDPRRSTVLHTLTPAAVPVQSLAFSADGSQLALACPAGVELWDVASGLRRHLLEDARQSVQFGPLPGQLVTGSAEGAILWDARSGRAMARWAAGVPLVSFSADGRRMATAGLNATVSIRQGDGREVVAIPMETGLNHLTAFSPDGSQIAIGATWDASEITICDSSSGQVLQVLRGHTGYIESLAYSRDGRRLLSASKDGSARIWEAVDGRELLVLRPDGKLVPECDLAIFTTDETGILVLYHDGTARRWDAATPQQVAAWEDASAAHRARLK